MCESYYYVLSYQTFWSCFWTRKEQIDTSLRSSEMVSEKYLNYIHIYLHLYLNNTHCSCCSPELQCLCTVYVRFSVRFFENNTILCPVSSVGDRRTRRNQSNGFDRLPMSSDIMRREHRCWLIVGRRSSLWLYVVCDSRSDALAENTSRQTCKRTT